MFAENKIAKSVCMDRHPFIGVNQTARRTRHDPLYSITQQAGNRRAYYESQTLHDVTDRMSANVRTDRVINQ